MKAQLQTAYWWHCPNCDAVNFAIPTKPELTDEDAEYAYRRFNELNDWCELPADWRDFELLTAPDSVSCAKCSRTFEAEEM